MSLIVWLFFGYYIRDLSSVVYGDGLPTANMFPISSAVAVMRINRFLVVLRGYPKREFELKRICFSLLGEL